MKKFFCLILTIASITSSFASELNGHFMGWSFDNKFSFLTDYRFQNNNYEIDFVGADKQTFIKIPSTRIDKDGFYIEKGSFITYKNQDLPFIKFNANDSFQLLEKTGLLYCKTLLYLCLGNQVFFETGPVDKDPTISFYADFNSITTSSFLTEKDTVYDGKTFSYYNKNLIPWVENVPGEGIGEWIEVTLDNKLDYYEVNNLDTVLISNGYVNFDKPQLYSANNRVKKIQITCPENGMDFEAELEDTAQFQAIKLPEPLPQKKKVTVRFTIKEVYKGTRWNDTCINRILIANSEFLEK